MINVCLRLLAFCLANGLIFAGYFFWLYRRRWSFSAACAGAFLLSLFQLLATLMGLAACGWLRWWSAAGLNLLFSGLLWGLSRRHIGPLLRRAWRRMRAFWRCLPPFSKIVALLLLLAAIWSGVVIWFFPVRDFDGNWYHVPIAILRLQQGDLGRLSSPSSFISAYPENFEFGILWTFLWMRTQTLADSIPWVFWLFGLLALYRLGRRFGAYPGTALLGSGVWGFAPVALLYTRTAYNDLIVAALFWLGLSLACHRSLSLGRAGLVAITIGLLVGIKYYALPYAAVLGVVALWNLWHETPRERRARTILLFLLICLVACGPSLFWYVVNALDLGNPFFPYVVRLGPWELPGWLELRDYDQSYTPVELQAMPRWRRLWTVWMEPLSQYRYDSRLGGFGPLWALLGIPALLVWFVLERRSYPLLVITVVLLLHPFSWHTRFVLFLPGVGGIALAVVLSRFRRGIRWATQLVYVAGVLFSLVVTSEVSYWNFFALPAPYRTMGHFWPGVFRWFEVNAGDSAGVFWYSDGLPVAPLSGEDLRHPLLYAEQEIPPGTEWLFVRGPSPTASWLEGHPGVQRVAHGSWPIVTPRTEFLIYRVLSQKRSPP